MITKTTLRVLDSWCLSKEEIKEFLEYLAGTMNKGENVINVDRMMNEWIWHNKAFRWGIAKGPARSVDVYLNADDDRHGFLSKILIGDFGHDKKAKKNNITFYFYWSPPSYNSCCMFCVFFSY